METKYLIVGGIIIVVVALCGIASVLGYFTVKNSSDTIQSQSCDLLADHTMADDCYYGLAKNSHDVSYCSKILNQTQKAECINLSSSN